MSRYRSIFARLRRASLEEILYRFREAAFLLHLRWQLATGRQPIHPPRVEQNQIAVLALPEWLGAPAPEEVERILMGKRYSLHASTEDVARYEQRWQGTFCKNVMQPRSPLDIRAVWEKGRLQHLAVLRVASQLLDEGDSRRDAVEAFILDELRDWLKANAFGYGPHYICPMECGLRLPILIVGLKLAAGRGDQKNFSLLLKGVYEHGWAIVRRLALYSSLGNHTVAECVGLLHAGLVFREDKEGNGWLEESIKLLDQVLQHQILADGGPVEQSLTYHRFVLDLYWLAVDLLERNGLKVPIRWRPRLRAGERFFQELIDRFEDVPRIGDSDDGWAVGPGLAPKREIPEKTMNGWTTTFPRAGYSVARLTLGGKVVFDHGSLGMAPLYNHGHADALAIQFACRGMYFLVDPGTFAYNGAPRWRTYFRSTSAHNTVCVDGHDQAVQETRFIWDRPFHCCLLRNESGEKRATWEASHDGYERLPSPVTHFRRVEVFRAGQVIIVDTFQGEGEHRFALHLHFHPEVSVTLLGAGWWRLERRGVAVFLRLDENFETQCFRGSQSIRLGWYSPAYGRKIPTTTLRQEGVGRAIDISFKTVIRYTGFDGQGK